jgi:Uma2 family endonuclease
MAETRETETRLTAADFMDWYEAQPSDRRYELFDGIAYEMQAERLIHAETKARVTYAFQRQIAERRLSCQALGDGMAVRVDEETVFEPDALVRCGPALPEDTTLLLDPMIVVELASPTTQRVDVLKKFSRYFRNPHIAHYLIVIPRTRIVIHHKRTADDRIETTAYESGAVPLDPPGFELALADIFPAEPPAG